MLQESGPAPLCYSQNEEQGLDLYAVFGNPIHHSLSPEVHALFAKETDQRIHYVPILVPVDKLNEAIKAFVKRGGKGANVTLPFKQEAFNLVTKLSDRALKAGAVNTLVFTPDVPLFGDNTDGAGLVQDLKENKKLSLEHQRILILGAGGAVRGILRPLLNEGVEKIVIANRSFEKAEALMKFFQSKMRIEAMPLNNIVGEYDIIINAISAGLENRPVTLPSHIVLPDTFCYDLVYSKDETPFIQWAKQQGALKVSDGLGMLVCQAAESFYLWRGVRPKTGPVIDYLRQKMSSSN